MKAISILAEKILDLKYHYTLFGNKNNDIDNEINRRINEVQEAIENITEEITKEEDEVSKKGKIAQATF